MEIKHFGPIDEARIIFDRYTVLIGKQGSVKSTVAKLYSLFTWLEKSLIRGMLSAKYITQYSRFQKNYCKYHRIDGYFKTDTFIFFDGIHYRFLFDDGKLSIEEKNIEEEIKVSKVMYVPAERNFLSTVDSTSALGELPPALQTFLIEFDKAKLFYKSGYDIPIDGMRFKYDALNKIPYIEGSDHKVRLSESSSGFQSVLPMLLVSSFLASLVSANNDFNDLSHEDVLKIHSEVEKIMNDESLSDEVKFAMARNISAKFSYYNFVNIVEEMEQNLYPESQKDVLFELLHYTNENKNNRLLLTTHSPYIISYLTIAVKAWQLDEKISSRDGSEIDNYRENLGKILPSESMIDGRHLKIYEMGGGTASLLNTYNGMPSDENVLNYHLGLTNEMFDQLFEIEEEWDNA